MTYLAGLPAHPLVVHAAVVLLPIVALAVAAAPFFADYRAKFAKVLVIASALAVILGLIASNSGEGLEHALGEEGNALLEKHAELGDTISIFTVSTLLAAALIWWMQSKANAGTAVSKSLSTGIAALAVVAGVATTVQVVLIGHSGAKTVWCEDSPSCAATQPAG